MAVLRGVATAVLLAAVVAVATALDEAVIRCKVCERAIHHVWAQGEELRSKCAAMQEQDPRCHDNAMHQHSVDAMVHEVCDALPKTHKALTESEFDLVLHEDPQHPEGVARAIKTTCRKYLHEQHGDEVGLYMYANLDVGKTKEQILPALTQRFCRTACDPTFKLKRDFHDDL